MQCLQTLNISIYQILKDIHEIALSSIDIDKCLSPKKKRVSINEHNNIQDMLKQAKEECKEQSKLELKEKFFTDREYFLNNRMNYVIFDYDLQKELLQKLDISFEKFFCEQIEIKEKKEYIKNIYMNIKYIEYAVYKRLCAIESPFFVFWEYIKKVYTQMYLFLTKCVLNMCTLHEARKIGTIKWFKYEENYVDNSLHTVYKVRIMNAKIVQEYNLDRPLKDVLINCIISYKKDSNVYNHESLVLLFENEEYPNVLFSGDSDYIWLKKSEDNITLKFNSIVTAAHHGSKTGMLVYDSNYVHDKNGDNNTFIFLRSDSKNTNGYTRRPCKKYISMKKKYCTYCAESKIVLDYESSVGEFVSEQERCKCK